MGILLDDNNDLLVRNKDFVVGDTTIQDVYFALTITQGDLKSDPIIGANLHRYIRGKIDRTAIQKEMRIALKRIGINDTDNIMNYVETIINKEIIL